MFDPSSACRLTHILGGTARDGQADAFEEHADRGVAGREIPAIAAPA